MLEKMRYLWTTFRNLYSYSNAFNNFFLDYYLRHHKIIGWYKGLPVNSSFLTPQLSKPLAHTLSRRLLSNLIQKPLPGMVSVGITDICNAKCEHCSFYNAMDKPGRKVLSTEEMIKVLKECQNFGLTIINFVGGEPLLRKDLPKLIMSLDKDRSVSSIFTNGWFLQERAKELKKAGTMMVLVSLDSHDPKTHDSFRRVPGLFEKAITGIKECQKEGLLTGISTTLTQEDLENGNFEKRLLLAKKLKVNEVVVFDTMPIGMYSHKEDLMRKKIDRKTLFEIVDKYNKLKDFPGVFCYAHFRDISAFGCSAGRNYFYITPYGEVCPCDFTAKPIGNLGEESLPHLWFKLVDTRSKIQSCYVNKCCEQKAEVIPISQK